jgi:outer membrane protein OmpA-like peptidoglycan-associated protein
MLARGVNYWISWADLTFMLFIAGLAAATASEEHRARAQQNLSVAQRKLGVAEEALNAAQSELEVLRRHSNPCADAGPFLERFSSCVAGATGRRQLQHGGCFVTVGEDVIRFANGEAVPLDAASADAVAGCLYANARRFAADDPRSFAAITIHIDGHTDCVGASSDNELLGAQRALSVYSRLLARAEADEAWPSAAAKRAFLSRIAVRSFGQSRPVEGSRCTQEGGWAGDRRVVISVQLATEGAAPAADQS